MTPRNRETWELYQLLKTLAPLNIGAAILTEYSADRDTLKLLAAITAATRPTHGN